MIEIDVTKTDIKTKQKIDQFENAAQMLSDLLTSALVREARQLAPVALRTSINRRRVGQTWRVFARNDEAKPYIEAAVRDFNWVRALGRLLRQLT